MNQEILDIIKNLNIDIDKSALLAFIEVETGGKGFDPKTGKIMIQFEPNWFRKFAPDAPEDIWSANKVDVQSAEWTAFNNAYKYNPEAAMKATSIGLGQIMGFNYSLLCYNSVVDMWNDAKSGLAAQIGQVITFIKATPKLNKAINSHDWEKCASIYNGAGYKKLAAKLNIVPYDIKLGKAYEKWKNKA